MGDLNEYLDEGLLSTDRVDLLKPPAHPQPDCHGHQRGPSSCAEGHVSRRWETTYPPSRGKLSLSLYLRLCAREETTFTLVSRPPHPFTPVLVLNKLACWQKDTLLSVLCVRRTMCVALSSQRGCIKFPTDFLKRIRRIGAAGEGRIPTLSVPGVKIHKVPHLDHSTM